MEFLPLLLQDYCSRLLRNDASLVELNLKCAGMNNHDEYFRVVVERLKDSCTVVALDLFGNSLGTSIDSMRLVGSLLRVNHSLRVVNLDNNNIDGNSFDTLCRGLRHNSSLIELSLNDNNLGARGGDALGEFLAYNSTIQKISLDRNRLGGNGVLVIFRGLIQGGKHSAVRELSLSGNNIIEQASFAMPMSSLATTSVCDKALRTAIRELLRTNPSLQVLNLSSNGLGATHGLPATIAQALGDNDSLDELDMSDNGLDDADAASFTDALAVNHTLRKLHLDDNPLIGVHGVTSMLQSVRRYNLDIELIRLSDCGCKLNEKAYKEKEGELRYWLEANRAGRSHVYQNAATLPSALWPLVLERVRDQPDAMNCFLRSKPELMLTR